MHMPHLHKPWFLSKNTLAGIGLGLIGATVVFYKKSDADIILLLQIGVIGLFLFIYAKGRPRHHSGYGYSNYGGHHKKHH